MNHDRLYSDLQEQYTTNAASTSTKRLIVKLQRSGGVCYRSIIIDVFILVSVISILIYSSLFYIHVHSLLQVIMLCFLWIVDFFD